MLRLTTSIVAFISMLAVYAQNPSSEVPKLVVGITIDQLRGDYLELFKNTFGNKGFNRLMNDGLVYNNVNYNFPNLDKASTITSIFTGSNPSYHGIIAENKYTLNTNIEISSFHDDNYLGNFTTEKMSPLPIKVSTITDELKIASGGQSDIFAFAPDASQALASGGHAASGAYWIENEDAKWATTTFYKTSQPVVDQFNRSQQSLTYTINSLSWKLRCFSLH